MIRNNKPDATATLKQIQLRLSVLAGRQLTHSELADIAGVSVRSIGEWMRGSTTPPSIPALLRLLSSLSQEDISSVLVPWETPRRNSIPTTYIDNQNKKFSSVKRSTKSRKKTQHTTTDNRGTS